MRNDQAPLRLDEQRVCFSSEPSFDVDGFGGSENDQGLSEVELEIGIRERGFGSVGRDVGWDEGGVGGSDVGVDWEKDESLIGSKETRGECQSTRTKGRLKRRLDFEGK